VADDIPDPLNPVMITMSGTFLLLAGNLFLFLWGIDANPSTGED